MPTGILLALAWLSAAASVAGFVDLAVVYLLFATG